MSIFLSSLCGFCSQIAALPLSVRVDLARALVVEEDYRCPCCYIRYMLPRTGRIIYVKPDDYRGFTPDYEKDCLIQSDIVYLN